MHFWISYLHFQQFTYHNNNCKKSIGHCVTAMQLRRTDSWIAWHSYYIFLQKCGECVDTKMNHILKTRSKEVYIKFIDKFNYQEWGE